MSGLVLLLIFGVAYPLIAITCMCIGVFGIAATMPERRQRCIAEGKAAWYSESNQISSARSRLFGSVSGLLALSIAAGCVWPIGIPVWIAWRKGSFVADALVKRDEVMAAERAA